ncbi:Uncharacterized protein involved in outer membrane biogenesis [Nitrosospira multiformis]|uniref:Uncharacterized protein involved in outer membrane biogenesis n=1 Tax=Nitrosospira multiformis TaxID=1231 RepID=A0A1H8LRF6_9PROT|nr:DUF748 domain-containing protein [Nitrosospira multiformis]SEO07691.1 Uncharacterized protein involved in outer membrane biogenesis [Nitrosospira multiformis]
MSSLTTFLHRFIRHRRFLIGLSVFAGIIILFGLLGYFWLPGYTKAKLEAALSDVLHRPVTVQSIDIQPYTLELTVRGFRIGEKETSVDADKNLFSFDELYLDLSIASIAHRAPVISSVSLKGPAVRLVREAQQQFNITDLIEDFMKRPKEEEEERGKSMFSVQNIVIKDGRFEFVDHVKKSQQEISDIQIGVPFIANFESAEETWVEPRFSARVNGAPFNLTGKLRPFTTNREATLEIRLSDVDLTRIDEYSPIPVGIHLLSGYFDSELLLTFAQVDGQSPALVLTGNAALKKLKVENHSVEAPYAATLGEFNVQLTEINLNAVKPSRAAVVLTEIAVTPEGSAEPTLNLPKLMLDEIVVDTGQKNVSFGAATLDRFNASLRRHKDGRLDLARLFTPINRAEKASQSSTPPSPQADTGKPWTVKLGSFKLADAALRFEDATLPDVAPMVVNTLDLAVNQIDFSGTTPSQLELKAEVNKTGSLETKGTLAWAPVAADLAVNAKDVDLVALQGWAGDRLNVLFSRGALSFRGKIKADGGKGQERAERVRGEKASPLKVAVRGDGRLTNFNMLDKADATNLMRWRSVDIKGIEFANEPLSINAASITLTDFFAHVVVTPQGELNLKYIVRQEETAVSPSQAAAAPATTPEPEPASTSSEISRAAPVPSQPPPRKNLPVRIGRIVMQGGHVNFQDQFIQPNYRAYLTDLAGRIGPLNPRKTGEVDIRGAVDKTAPLKISGSVDAFGRELYLDITASAKGIDMPTFSPYSGKYIGYEIEKGKLSVDVHYHVEHGELTAENSIFLDQLTFGEKIESPDALSIPVNLALALLKNRRGEIDIRLPISGSINDPKFSLGGIIVKAILNLLTKAATAPFTVLGSLFGGEELSEINFPAGEVKIPPEAEERLQKLAQALTDRPALNLEIIGHADASSDPEPLKRGVLERKIKAEKLSVDIKKGKSYDSLEDVTLTPEEYEKYLEQIYKDAKFEKPKNFIGLSKSLPTEEMEKLMLANIDAGDAELEGLAESRAMSARDWLIEHGGIPDARIFVLSPKVEAGTNREKPGNRVEFSLR